MEDATLSAMVKSYGQVIVDECHVVSAPSFERVVHAVPAQYVLGLSATPIRKDGQHPIIEMECGPVRHRVDVTGMDLFGAFRHLVRVRPTPFVPKQDTFDRLLEYVREHFNEDMTQQELAVRSGINQANISKIENGVYNPSLAIISRLADAMDMDLHLQLVPRNGQSF